jgi:hypothetical protein
LIIGSIFKDHISSIFLYDYLCFTPSTDVSLLQSTYIPSLPTTLAPSQVKPGGNRSLRQSWRPLWSLWYLLKVFTLFLQKTDIKTSDGETHKILMSETPLKKLNEKDENLLFGEASAGQKIPTPWLKRDNYGNPVSR